MKKTMTILFLAAALGAAGCNDTSDGVFTTGGNNVPAEIGRTYSWNFDGDAAGALPDDLINVLGDWAVAEDGSSPSTPNLVRQSGSFGNPDFPRVVVKDLDFDNLAVSVRCRAESGDTDQACGLMFRFQDSDNYFITRANALEGNVRLYRVVDGVREQFASADLDVTANDWHTLSATARGAELTVSWDDQQVIAASDSTFASGKIGLWTKADSVTAFDDLQATAE
jgi:hypothetical protein